MTLFAYGIYDEEKSINIDSKGFFVQNMHFNLWLLQSFVIRLCLINPNFLTTAPH